MKKKYLYLIFTIIICFLFKASYVSATVAKDCIDYPLSNTNYSDNITVQGWIMSTENIDNIKAYINDTDIDFAYERYKRKDVINAIKGYGENPTPGFKGTINISTFEKGTYTLKLEYYSQEKLISVSSKKITINESSRIYIDDPKGTINGTNINIQGWVMNSSSSNEINVYIDNNPIQLKYEKVKRTDVLNTIKGYGDSLINNKPGFKGNIDASNLKNGKHTIKVDSVNSKGEILSSSSRNFNLNKYKSTIRIDSPSINYKNNGTNLNISGWYLSTLKNTSLQVLIDNTDVTNQIQRTKRSDAIKTYGKEYNATSNELAGYKGTVDVSKFTDGKHTIKVIVKNNNIDEKIIDINRNFTLEKHRSTIRLDSPSINYKNNGTNLNISGWYLSTLKNTTLQVLIDNTDVTNQIQRTKRNDAIKAYGKEYNATSNELAGYKGTVDVSKFKDGKHMVKVIVKNNDTGETLTNINRNFNLNKYKSTIRIDGPSANSKSIGTDLTISGWYLSTSKNTTLQVLIDSTNVTEQIQRVQRNDAIKAYGKEYNAISDELAGYKGTIDVTNFKDGKHTVKVIVKNNDTNENLIYLNSSFTLKKYDGTITIDYPTRTNFNKTHEITVQGWELSSCDNSTIEISVDNNKKNVIRYERADVLRVYPNSYGGAELNQTPGFTSTFSLNKLSDGMHTIKIKLYNKVGEVIEEKKINIFTYSNTYFGIDVSSHQGNINWDEVKRSGIDFAIIRLGYGSNFTSQDDVQFKNNVAGAARNGIPFGLYLYSYATIVHGPNGVNIDSPNSDSEAAHALRQINSLKKSEKTYLKLPVFIDMEEGKTAYLGMPILTAIADNFCNKVQVSTSYKCGVYANKNWLSNYLDSYYLASKYDIWLAHYTGQTDYRGTYQIWQYSSSGGLRGINSQGLDLNISYKKYW